MSFFNNNPSQSANANSTNQSQQQIGANSFFGAAANQPQGSSFGFGGATAPAFGQGSAFGQATGNTSFLGGGNAAAGSTAPTSGFGGGSFAFGQQQPQGSIFGSNTAPSTGATSNIFGQQTGTTSFGMAAPSTSTNIGTFGQASQQAAPPSLSSSGSAIFGGAPQATQPATTFGAQTSQPFGSTTSSFGNFGAQPQQPASQPIFGASTTPGTFGQTSTTGTSSFNFGAPQQQTQTPSLFKPATSTTFGSASAPSAITAPTFGSSQPTTNLTFGGSLFGQPQAPQQQQTSQNSSATASPFGQAAGTNTFSFNQQPAVSSMPPQQTQPAATFGFSSTSAPTLNQSALPTAIQPTSAQGTFGQNASTGIFGTQTTSAVTAPSPLTFGQSPVVIPTTTDASATKPLSFGGFGTSSTTNPTNAAAAPVNVAQNAPPASTSLFNFGSQPASSQGTATAAESLDSKKPVNNQPSTGLSFTATAAPASSLANTDVGASKPATLNFTAPISAPKTAEGSTATVNLPFAFGKPPAASPAKESLQAATNEVSKPSLSFGLNIGSSTTQAAPNTISASDARPGITFSAPTKAAEEKADDKKAPEQKPSVSLPQTITFPSTLKNKTLEEIVTGWKDELEAQVAEFQRQAVIVGQWDRRIVRNGENILALNEKVVQMEAMQTELEQNLSYVSAQQAELEGLLDALEREMEPFVEAATQSRPRQPADQERERIYDQSETLQQLATNLATTLGNLVTQVNSASVSEPEVPSKVPAKKSGDSSIDADSLAANEPASVVDIVKVLNSHLDSLQWIDQQITGLRQAASSVSRMGERATAEQERLGHGHRF